MGFLCAQCGQDATKLLKRASDCFVQGSVAVVATIYTVTLLCKQDKHMHHMSIHVYIHMYIYLNVYTCICPYRDVCVLSMSAPPSLSLLSVHAHASQFMFIHGWAHAFAGWS